MSLSRGKLAFKPGRRAWNNDENAPQKNANDENTNEDTVTETIHDKYKKSHANANLEEVVNRRFDVLYNDSKVRKLRQRAMEIEKERVQEEFYAQHQRYLATEGQRRQMTPAEFQEYWNNRTIERQNHLTARIQEKMIRDKQKEEEEMAECTFRPFLATKDSFMRKRVRIRLKLKKMITDLARKQQEHLDMLESLHAVENNVEQRLKLECESKLTEATEKNVSLVDEFLATESGRNLVTNRTQAYLRANEGLDEIQAEQEAITDILTKNKDNIRERVMEEFRARRIAQRRNLAIRKIQVVVELQKLEIKFQELAMDVTKHHDVLAAIHSLEYDAVKQQAREKEDADRNWVSIG